MTLIAATELEVVVCPVCGVLHGVPASLLDTAREACEALPVHCPSGHAWSFAPVDPDDALAENIRLQAELDRARAGEAALLIELQRARASPLAAGAQGLRALAQLLKG